MGRLIDADALIEAINKSTCHWAENMWKQVVRDVIYNQPTAYDVEKVVAELEKASVGAFDIKTILFRRAIEIVRKGGAE